MRRKIYEDILDRDLFTGYTCIGSLTKGKDMKNAAAYIRVSTFDQDKGLDSQKRAIKEWAKNNGIKRIQWYVDKISGVRTNRPAFNKLQKDIFAGKIGIVICWKLDRLSRSLKDGINVLTDWCQKEIRIVSVTQQLDFNGTVGQLIASVLLAVAQMERENVRENTLRGLRAAKARGVQLGRPRQIETTDVLKLQKKGLNITQIAQKLGKSRQAIYDALGRE